MVNFHVMTLFPEMIEQGVRTSITGRAIEKGIITLNAVNIRDFSHDRHHHVDDYPYGGGAGMVMQPEPVFECYEHIAGQISSKEKKPRVIYMTPQGKVFSQRIAEELSKEEDLIFLCGHYEGIDERVLDEIVTDHLSAGDYVLTGGELPAMVMIDAIARLVPGVLNNDASAEDESFQDGLLEYPQYTRPPVFHGREVPAVLLTGDHTKIEAWRRQKSVERTLERRPDLLEAAVLDAQGMQYLAYAKGKAYADHMCRLYEGAAEVLEEDKRMLSENDDRLCLGDSHILSWLQENSENILDVGAGCGVRFLELVTGHCVNSNEKTAFTGIEATAYGMAFSRRLTAGIGGRCTYGMFDDMEKITGGHLFDAVIVKDVFDRLLPKDSKKLLKKIARLTGKGGKVYVELSGWQMETLGARMLAKHTVMTAQGALYRLDTDTWCRIFAPYFEILEVSTREKSAGCPKRIFLLTGKM